MNEIRFDIQHGEFGDLIVPTIDGRSLVNILKEIELPFCKKEGTLKIAGKYGGLPISLVRLPSKHYYGEESQRTDGKSKILICDCLCAGCWDFVAKIEMTNKKIIWKDFEQIHRVNWNYDELGSLEFDKEQFKIALKELENK
ncbi:MAG: hypothetical protein ABI891_05950 [Acidobacteriota bacterium]